MNVEQEVVIQAPTVWWGVAVYHWYRRRVRLRGHNPASAGDAKVALTHSGLFHHMQELMSVSGISVEELDEFLCVES